MTGQTVTADIVQRDDDYMGRKVLELPGKGKRGRPKVLLDLVKEDMQEVGAMEDKVFARSVWRIRCGDP